MCRTLEIIGYSCENKTTSYSLHQQQNACMVLDNSEYKIGLFVLPSFSPPPLGISGGSIKMQRWVSVWVHPECDWGRRQRRVLKVYQRNFPKLWWSIQVDFVGSSLPSRVYWMYICCVGMMLKAA